MTPKKPIPRTVWGFTTFIAREIVVQKKWFLLPVWILLLGLALMILVGGSSALLPAIYIAF